MSRVFLVDFYFQKENKDLFRQQKRLFGMFCNNMEQIPWSGGSKIVGELSFKVGRVVY